MQAGFALLHGQRRLPAGPWDEAGQWLAGADAMRKDFEASQPTLWHARVGGIFQLRAGRARMSLRCPELFRHRPSQADLLHVEVEWRGHPIAHDAGTFSYNSTSPLTSALSRAVTHNTLTFDDSEPMDKASRFLYLPWPRGATELNESAKIFSARHYGWRKLGLTHTRRASSPSDEIFLVEDLISGAGAHSARLHWLLADYPHEFDPVAAQLVLRTPVGKFSVSWTAPDNVRASLVRAEASGARGWWAPAYGSSAPALSLVIEVPFTGDLVLTTRFAPA